MWAEAMQWGAWWWDRLLHYHQVNPLIFFVMYGIKSPIWWWTLFLIVQRARRRDWDSLPGLILFNVATNVSPWMYVYLWGRNLPWWYPYMVWWLVGWGLVYLVLQIRRKLHQYAGNDLESRAGLREARDRAG